MEAYAFDQAADPETAGSAADLPPAPPIGGIGPDPSIDALPLPDARPRPDSGPPVPPQAAAALDLPGGVPEFLTKLQLLMVLGLTRIKDLEHPRFDDHEKRVLGLIQRNHRRNRARFPGLRPVHTYHLASLVIGTLDLTGSLPIREFARQCNRLHRQEYGSLVARHHAEACLVEDLPARPPIADPLLECALERLDEPTRALLRDRYLGRERRTSQELAAELGISDPARLVDPDSAGLGAGWAMVEDPSLITLGSQPDLG